MSWIQSARNGRSGLVPLFEEVEQQLAPSVDAESFTRTPGLQFTGLAAAVSLIVLSSGAVFAVAARSLRPTQIGLALGVIASLILLDGAALQSAAWPVFSVYAFVSGFAVLAFVAAQSGLAEGRIGLSMLASLAFAVAAGFGNAAGAAVWPVLLWQTWRTGDRGKLLGVIALVAAVALALTLEGATSAQAAAGASTGIAHIVKVVRYFGGYCALPWSGGAPRLTMEGLGWIIAAGGVLLLRRPPAAFSEAIVLRQVGRSLILFALITALMAAIGRVDELPAPVVPTRYTVFADLLHVGMFLAAAPTLVRLWSQRPRVAQSGLIALCLVLLAQEVVLARKVDRYAAAIRAASVAFDRGDRSAHVVALVYAPSSKVADRIRRRLKSAHSKT